ncbi:MAG TPA: SPOR domain-containing protein [Gemmatimonadaceae bacterium]|nr:SPOR domain-containing protein [Gemmatimonadaceae bacterium]
MSRFAVLSFVVLLPVAAHAQTAATPPTDSIFARAQHLVAEGQADSGRALVQQQLDAATPGTAKYVEALYWHGVLAATAADAERDYRRIIVEYPLSPRMDDALMSLAQLEMARGDQQQALDHLARLVREHPSSPARARATYWMARALFDEGDLPRGCARLADAGRHVTAADVELRNRIDYYGQRCLGVDTTGVAVVAADTPRASSGAASGQRSEAMGRDSARPPAQRSTPPATRNNAGGERASSGSATANAVQFTVQVGAYATRTTAAAKQHTLTAAGFDARVVGAGKLFRVRVGRYPSRAAALDVARQLVQKKLAADPFVTEAEGRGA